MNLLCEEWGICNAVTSREGAFGVGGGGAMFSGTVKHRCISYDSTSGILGLRFRKTSGNMVLISQVDETMMGGSIGQIPGQASTGAPHLDAVVSQ